MHLIIAIALGVFGGLWLFTRWGEWREARWERREMKRIERAERAVREAGERAHAENERARAQAMLTPTPVPPIARYGFCWPRSGEGWLMNAYMVGLLALFPVLYLIFRHV